MDFYFSFDISWVGSFGEYYLFFLDLFILKSSMFYRVSYIKWSRYFKRVLNLIFIFKN